MTAKRDRTKERSVREEDARARLVKTVVDFVQPVLLKRGEILVNTVGFAHTHTIRELLNFGDFSFRTDTGQTVSGESEAKVWYHPRARFNKDVSVLVFHARWQTGIEKYEVKLDSGKRWQRELLKVIRGKKTIAARSAKKVLKYEEEQRKLRLDRRLKGLYAL